MSFATNLINSISGLQSMYATPSAEAANKEVQQSQTRGKQVVTEKPNTDPLPGKCSQPCEFRWATSLPKNIDPVLVYYYDEEILAESCFEGLLAPAEHGNYSFGVAKEFGVSKDGLTYTFTLRDDAKWSNGEQVTAHDFVYSWKRVLNVGARSPGVAAMYIISGARKYSDSETDSNLGFRAIDNKTLEIKLTAPMPIFPIILTESVFAPVHKSTVEKHGKDWTKPENIVGNGPYIPIVWKNRDTIELSQNPHYWDNDRVQIEKVVIRDADQDKTKIDWYQLKDKKGGIDWIFELPPTHANEFPETEIAVHNTCGQFYIALNTKKAPFDNVEFRRNFSKGIDRKRMARIFSAGNAAMLPIPIAYKSISLYSSIFDKVGRNKFRFDLDGAKEYFNNSRYMRDVEYTHDAIGVQQDIAATLVRQAKEFGFKLQGRQYDPQTTKAKLREGSYQAGRAGWMCDYPDPLNNLQVHVTNTPDNPNLNNITGFSNHEYDRLYELAQKESDMEVRNGHIADMIKILVKDPPIVPLSDIIALTATNPKIAKLPLTISGHPVLKGVRKPTMWNKIANWRYYYK